MRMNIMHMTPDFNYACGRSYYVYEVLKFLKQNNHNVILVTNGGDSLERLDFLGIPYVIVKNLKSKNFVTFLKNVKIIRSLIAEKDISVLHTHHRYSELIGLQAVKRKRKKVKTIFTALSIVNARYNIEYKSDKIISVSRAVRKMLVERFRVAVDRIVSIPNFTDTDEIQDLDTLSHFTMKNHGSTYNILAIGRFHHEKNFEILLKAMNILGSRKNKLVLVGEGDSQTDYRKYIRRHALNVEIVVPQRDLIEYFLIADVCVLPSARDPFPNFMLQSGLHKKPFIGAAVDGIAELIKDGHNGLLFHSGNEIELAEKIMKFKSNPPLARRCANHLYDEVTNNYTQQFVGPMIEKLYRETIAE